jgi:hypothetical protein
LSHFRAHPVFELHDNRVQMSPGQGTPLPCDPQKCVAARSLAPVSRNNLFRPEGPRRNFVNCPIVRDTASVPFDDYAMRRAVITVRAAVK